MRALNGNEVRVLSWLRSRRKVINDFVSPTEIAKAVKSPQHHSAWASPICLRLVAKGLIKRNKKGHYRAVIKDKS